VSPIDAVFAVREGTVTGVRSYLSDEATLKRLGHIDT
jgi:hypothetical protein